MLRSIVAICPQVVSLATMVLRYSATIQYSAKE